MPHALFLVKYESSECLSRASSRASCQVSGSFDHFAPENVSSVVVWLCSEESGHVTGKIIEAEGGRIALADGWRSTEGIEQSARWDPSEVGAVMTRLLDQEQPPQKVWGS